MKLNVGDQAPTFSLPDQNGLTHNLNDYIGKWVLVYFYPKDGTPGCIKEACALRDNFPFFEKLEAKVLGISTDSIESHKKFEEKHKLPFTLLADDKKEVVKMYGVWGEKKIFGKAVPGTSRTSFLINPEGKIAKIYQKVNPALHPKEVIEDLEKLK